MVGTGNAARRPELLDFGDGKSGNASGLPHLVEGLAVEPVLDLPFDLFCGVVLYTEFALHLFQGAELDLGRLALLPGIPDERTEIEDVIRILTGAALPFLQLGQAVHE